MKRHLRRAILPVAVSATVLVAQFVWLGLFPERDPTQDRWAVVPSLEPSWWTRYVVSQSYWLGISYAMSLAFAAVVLRRYRETKENCSGKFAIGSVTFSGVLAVAACWLVGCCGSPMLVVYLNLFGAAFLPFAKPFVAGLTAASLLIAWWWLNRGREGVRCQDSACPAEIATKNPGTCT